MTEEINQNESAPHSGTENIFVLEGGVCTKWLLCFLFPKEEANQREGRQKRQPG